MATCDEVTVHAVVDTNIVIASPRLQSAAWRAALLASRNQALAIHIPEVVLLEVLGWLRRELPNRLNSYHKAVTQLSQIGAIQETAMESLVSSARDEDQFADEYRDYLHERIGLNAVLPIPNIPHRDLVDQAIRRMKPFSENGSGYRDALIWETVCVLAENHPVVFVTNNHRDFGEERGLAGELKADLIRRGFEPDRVELLSALEDVVARLSAYTTDASMHIQEILRSKNTLQILESAISREFAQNDGIPLESTRPPADPLIAGGDVEAIWDVHDVVVLAAVPTGYEGYLVTATATCQGQAYMIHEEPTEGLLRAAEAGERSGRLTEVREDRNELLVVQHLPLDVEIVAEIELSGAFNSAYVRRASPRMAG